MSLQKTTRFVIGDQTTRATLESTYTGTNISEALVTRNATQVFLEIEYTMGAAETANSIEVKIEFADTLGDNRALAPTSTDWYREAVETLSGGTATVNVLERTFAAVSAAATYDRFVLDVPGGHDFMRVSIKETGVAANKGSASVKLITIEQETIN